MAFHCRFTPQATFPSGKVSPSGRSLGRNGRQRSRVYGVPAVSALWVPTSQAAHLGVSHTLVGFYAAFVVLFQTTTIHGISRIRSRVSSRIRGALRNVRVSE